MICKKCLYEYEYDSVKISYDLKIQDGRTYRTELTSSTKDLCENCFKSTIQLIRNKLRD